MKCFEQRWEQGGSRFTHLQFLGFPRRRSQTVVWGQARCPSWLPWCLLPLCATRTESSDNDNRGDSPYSPTYSPSGPSRKTWAGPCSKLSGTFLAVTVPQTFDSNDVKETALLGVRTNQIKPKQTKEMGLHRLEHRTVCSLVPHSQEIVLTPVTLCGLFDSTPPPVLCRSTQG